MKIYSTSANYKAELLKGLLMENGINAIIVNKQDSSYLWGDIEVLCRPDDVMKALLLVEKFKIA